ncbi:hypothetical protein [Streptomyces sp. NBC_00386]|jgi:hypothetical protein|uniref:hypothetical protein n=1 Tax=Streptomyces sp. NBC_00386 TaxID=2975734 RepID=UPI003FCE0369
MSTGVIIALIIVAAVAVVAAALTLRARRPPGGRSLRRRFGPEYDRTVARHDGDTQAAERDLNERVKRHGALRAQPLEPAARERYAAGWTAAQERFVDSPREAVTEADRLLGELAGARGFPDGDRYEEQVSALSVHHGHHVHGYRRVHRAALARTGGNGNGNGGVDTEKLREAMLEARDLFDDLLTPTREDTSPGRARDTDDVSEPPAARPERSKRFALTKDARRAEPEPTPASAGRTEPTQSTGRAGSTGPTESAESGENSTRTSTPDTRSHLPWSFTRRQAKGS